MNCKSPTQLRDHNGKIENIKALSSSLTIYLRAAEGIEKPLVMKSPFFDAPSFLEKRLSIFSLPFRRFFFSLSSANTRAVREEVAAFLMPFPEAPLGTGVEVLLRLLTSDVCSETTPAASAVTSAVTSAVACFLRFFEPGAFLRECVRACSASL